MSGNPRGDSVMPAGADKQWRTVLAHRQEEPHGMLEATVARLTAAGLTPADVHVHLVDGGDALYAAATSGNVDWADSYGGARAVALLAAEVSALMSHLV